MRTPPEKSMPNFTPFEAMENAESNTIAISTVTRTLSLFMKTAAMAIATAALRWLVLGSIRLPAALALLVFVPFGAAIYLATMYWRNKALLVEFLALARSGIGVFARARA